MKKINNYMSKHNQNCKADGLRKICLISIERLGFAVVGKNTLMKGSLGSTR